MNELLTSAQMRAIEQAAFDSGQATGLELMERAGQGVIEAMFEALPDLAKAKAKALILCGPGNNGGDGFVIARLLHEMGWQVSCFLYGDPGRLQPDAKANHDRWGEIGAVVPFADWHVRERWGGAVPVEQPPSLIVDSLFGTGLTRPLARDLDEALRNLASCLPEGKAWRVAVDAPSGLCMDSGRPLDPENDGELPSRQDLTVSFHRLKRGHMLGDGPEWCGRVAVADIGLNQPALRAARPALREQLSDMVQLAEPDKRQLRKGGEDYPGAHKYDYGHAVVLSGGPGRTGAARLAARAALRVGAGLVTLAAPAPAMSECASQLTAVMLTRCNGAPDLGTLLEDERLNALCLGPGLGVSAATRDLVLTALGSRRRCVLDADALTAFAERPQALFAHLHSGVVLTPHAGEFARLFPDIWARFIACPEQGPAISKIEAAQEAAARAGCILLFKGQDTVIVEPGGRVVVHAACYERAAPWLATAGAGDVLAGMIAGLMARGFWPVGAAETAAWLHAEAAISFGPGLIAEDLAEELPAVLRASGV
ncbi:NAD(P)H-hydrate dehydratase [Aliiruegeria lutimaris]|uniref:Bifunctional NAD(P)H-hydrate repair enzyme n=1 Tax=Aliiruegeria lutimaris TaxID=571298 RepID=A0A1G8PNQ6_9RHOB|nr:NAD(P)H-hydrate dehydratase [Aliiruegeria lutimaris]SDI94113.1 yjeF C-terminal region, hydroxyethylthiazole kinase-related/yjeF N-terminal region [Aliiruegeria lutimaris]